MTNQELEQIEDRARRGLPIDPEVILILTAYLRNILQAKINAEAIASEALRKAGLKSRYYTPETRVARLSEFKSKR
ncbi:MAG TPA: hypothetical protein VE056_06450 [Pyrinomonadaceae bacterium]|nr:hypothetical protein [Pyrinomonadaceae bacterium]